MFHAGEKAEDFYIINKGKVGVFSSVGGDLIAILEKGAFFGEISILITKKRTMTIECLSDTEFLTISKERLLEILEHFPKEKDFLFKVANQRTKTSTKFDIPVIEVILKLKYENLFNYQRINTQINNANGDRNTYCNMDLTLTSRIRKKSIVISKEEIKNIQSCFYIVY